MNGSLPTRPPAATPFGPPLHGGDLVRTTVIAIALLMVASLIVRELASSAGGRWKIMPNADARSTGTTKHKSADRRSAQNSRQSFAASVSVSRTRDIRVPVT